MPSMSRANPEDMAVQMLMLRMCLSQPAHDMLQGADGAIEASCIWPQQLVRGA